jgi:hypothetical protein
MPQERIERLFSEWDETTQKVVRETLSLEREYISYEKPRLKDQLDMLIERAAKYEVALQDREREETSPV